MQVLGSRFSKFLAALSCVTTCVNSTTRDGRLYDMVPNENILNSSMTSHIVTPRGHRRRPSARGNVNPGFPLATAVSRRMTRRGATSTAASARCRNTERRAGRRRYTALTPSNARYEMHPRTVTPCTICIFIQSRNWVRSAIIDKRPPISTNAQHHQRFPNPGG